MVTEPGFRCLTCESEERAIGPRFLAAVELHMAECMSEGHEVEAFGGLGDQGQDGQPGQ
jgi:hypothetical protein